MRKYADLDQDPVAAGRELNVESVLEGSIQKSDDRIRVTVRLLSVRDGKSLWAEKYDEQFTDIFTIQDRVAKQVAESLKLTLTGEEKKLLAKAIKTVNKVHDRCVSVRAFPFPALFLEADPSAVLFVLSPRSVHCLHDCALRAPLSPLHDLVPSG